MARIVARCENSPSHDEQTTNDDWLLDLCDTIAILGQSSYASSNNLDPDVTYDQMVTGRSGLDQRIIKHSRFGFILRPPCRGRHPLGLISLHTDEVPAMHATCSRVVPEEHDTSTAWSDSSATDRLCTQGGSVLLLKFLQTLERGP
jgi:hypothetical protein